MSLLPYNATKFERTVEQAIKYNVDPNVLAGFKFKTTSAETGGASAGDVVLFQQQSFQTGFRGIGSSCQTTIAGTHYDYIEMLIHCVPPFLAMPVK